MDPSNQFEFIVGEQYENEKGIFTVMSIEKGDMVIQWKDGDEAVTSIEFQSRIQKRRHYEKNLQETKAAAAKPAPRRPRPAKRDNQPPPA